LYLNKINTKGTPKSEINQERRQEIKYSFKFVAIQDLRREKSRLCSDAKQP
jgi:hypothetical protein